MTAKGKAPAFQFYASDFLVDTAEMTNLEVGVYIRLLSHQWVNGGLNSDPNRLANIVGIELLDVWHELSCKFVICDDGKIRNPKLEKVRDQQTAYRNSQSESGKKGAAKRWGNKEPAKKKDGDPDSKPISGSNSGKVALHSSSSSSKDQNTTSKPASRFDDFWEVCPKKVGKKKTKEIWKRRKLDRIADKIISDITTRMKNDKKWIDGFIPNPTTYLNGDRWEDEMQGAFGSGVPMNAGDEYAHYRKIGHDLGISPTSTESDRDYITRVKAAE